MQKSTIVVVTSTWLDYAAIDAACYFWVVLYVRSDGLTVVTGYCDLHGLVLTKAYGLHLRNATRKMGPCDASPPGLDTPQPPHHTGPIYI